MNTSLKKHGYRALVVFAMLATSSASFGSSAEYHYDSNGRLRSALYANGVCVVYNYDANGNRTSQTNTSAGAPETSQWGTGVWGCFKWSS